MTSGPGTYVLILISAESRCLSIGRLGKLPLRPGCYLYVGSAFGPGGVRARLAHHRKLAARPHWHVDFLRPHAALKGIWYTLDADRREHEWASLLLQLPGAEVPLPGFGSSDCRCPSHLVRLGRPPSFRAFQSRIRSRFPEHASVSSIVTAEKGRHAQL